MDYRDAAMGEMLKGQINAVYRFIKGLFGNFKNFYTFYKTYPVGNMTGKICDDEFRVVLQTSINEVRCMQFIHATGFRVLIYECMENCLILEARASVDETGYVYLRYRLDLQIAKSEEYLPYPGVVELPLV